MFIQCHIKKSDGSAVFVDFEGVRYIFSKNEVGDPVCFVGNAAHQRRLLAMGPGAYVEYEMPEEAGDPNFQPGAQGQPLGKDARRSPLPDEPLPDGITVDEALTATDEGAEPPQPEPPVEVEWAPEAVDTKIKEFKFLDKTNFKVFVEENADRIPGWPAEVKTVMAKKLNKHFPDLDPGIEGFVINDYLGSGNTVDP